MKTIDKMLSDLEKLFGKRSALDTKIQDMEAKFLSGLKAAARPVAPSAKKSTVKKARVSRKPKVLTKPEKGNLQNPSGDENNSPQRGATGWRQKTMETLRKKMGALPWKNREKAPPKKN
jgi:hypothetical protein